MSSIEIIILVIINSVIAVYACLLYNKLKEYISLIKKLREENDVLQQVISNRLNYYDNICKQIYEQYLEDDE